MEHLNPQRVFLDTNVLLDHLLQRDGHAQQARRALEACANHDVALLCASTSLKDIAYIAEAMVRRQFKQGESSLENETLHMLVRHVPWRCVEQARALCDIASIDQQTCDDALILRPRHDDFEDDLIIAAARQADADCVITSDAELIEHFPEYCVSPSHIVQSFTANAESDDR